MLERQESVRWLFYGDSITHGAKHTNGGRDFSELFRERLLWEMQRRSDLVLNSAFSGFTCLELLRDFEFRATAFKPHAAFVMIGSNDSVDRTLDEFEAQLNELADKFAAIDCQVVLQTPLPVLRNLDASRTRVPEFAEKVRKVAAERNLPLIDQFKAWSECPAVFYLHADALHPNHLGHIKIAHDIFKAMGIFETQNSRVCKFYAPDAL
ncbi:MAG: SGNH/GDSL hydrolase family protein [Lentisphaeria bacterium]|nr:SGNH/GDSL hydrolase family protein [Lentisphaeria bacterium]